MARPRKPTGGTKPILFKIRLSDAEHALFKKAAQRKSLDASSWARSRLVYEARKILAAI